MPEENRFVTYILSCVDGSLYTGWTNDLERRLEAHNNGTGAKYTRSRTPVKLLACWNFESKVEAMRMEYKIKRLPRRQKMSLIENKDSEAKN
ncbi:MAG: GIY-YIG nuclease family protein [Candidatus Obscuribacterales bacterium]|nr:GIY-YIG nuclease family protein [Candidatus Obscuribacterales bacterium]